MLRVILNGCLGRMGQAVAALARERDDVRIVAGVDLSAAATAPKTVPPAGPSPISPEDGTARGAEAAPTARAGAFPVYPSLDECAEAADVLIDFTSPDSLRGLLQGAVRRKLPVVLATTGFSEEDLAAIRRASEKIPIFQSANMSLGINLISELIQQAAILLGDQFDIEIIEKHHSQKKDSPSGTALALAASINEALGHRKQFVYGRHTRTEKRAPQELGIHAIRAGTIVGEHSVIFAGKDEVVELSHVAYSRQIFAAGALRAALYLQGKSPRLYTMRDMINEQSTVTNLATSSEEALVTMHQIQDDPHLIARIFQELGEADVNVDMISQTAPENGTVNLSFTLLRRDVAEAVRLLEGFRQAHPRLTVDVLRGIYKISVEGAGMERQSGVAAKVFSVMAREGISIRTVTTSETKISYCIDLADAERAVAAIREAFQL